VSAVLDRSVSFLVYSLTHRYIIKYVMIYVCESSLFLSICLQDISKVPAGIDETRHAGSFSSLSLEGINLFAPLHKCFIENVPEGNVAYVCLLFAIVGTYLKYIYVETMSKANGRRMKRKLVSTTNTPKCTSYLMKQHRDSER